MTEPYRVLALDGGGLRGIFTAAVLSEAEDAFGPAFVDSFDLLAGTSTGGIIALGLASGRTCREMLHFYRDAGKKIFSRPRRVRRLIGPKYDRRALDELLRHELGEATRMNDLSKSVCITAHELVRGTTRVWKDDHSPDLRWGGDQLVWKVAAATSAAPTYFAPVQLGDADSHIDGGVWGNNPAMVGITEAVRTADEIFATSVCCRWARHLRRCASRVITWRSAWDSRTGPARHSTYCMAVSQWPRTSKPDYCLGMTTTCGSTATTPARSSSTTQNSASRCRNGATTSGATTSSLITRVLELQRR